MAARVKKDRQTKVTFVPKQEWQKPNCLYCDQKATLEAAAARGNATANIRCCTALSCKRKAARAAREFVRTFST